MRESDFLLELERRTRENESLIKKSGGAFMLSLWFGEHPWRILIPLAFLLSLLFRAIFGNAYSELVLWIFGGL